jgi:hypothetical protein
MLNLARPQVFLALTSISNRHILIKKDGKRSDQMKKSVLLLLCIIIIFSCKSLPDPKNESDSLVIGSVIWDFPDGFFELQPRTLKNDITLSFVNLTTTEQFKVKVHDGYYNFLCNGNDKYILQYASYKSTGSPKTYTLGFQMNLQIDSKPQRIIYAGHIEITFANPETIQAKEGDAMIWTYWRFRETYTIENKIEDLKSHIAENDGKNKWHNYKILNLYEK